MLNRIDDLLRMAMSFGSSDLHLRAGAVPVIRVNGELRPMAGIAKLTQDETLEMAFSMMSNRQKQHFKEVYEVDIGYGVTGLGRFRVNIFQQRNSIGIVARVISDTIKNFAGLGLPPILQKIAEEQRGLILVTGTTGSGKSTTLASIVDAINAIKLAAANPNADAALLDQARNLHRKAQFMWDFVSAENSTGFHNPEYALKILAESTDMARQAQMLAAQSVNDMSLLATGTYYQPTPTP